MSCLVSTLAHLHHVLAVPFHSASEHPKLILTVHCVQFAAMLQKGSKLHLPEIA